MAEGMTFGRLEALLASVHEIASDKRIAFQGRLKALLRLGLPAGLKQGKGRTATYSPGDVVHMALLADLTRLGLTPERAVAMLDADHFPMFAAILRSVDVISAENWLKVRKTADGAAGTVLIYFNPNAHAVLAEGQPPRGLLWAGAAHVATELAQATLSPANRGITILNATALLDELVSALPSDQGVGFLADVRRWAEAGTYGQPKRSIIPDWETS